MEHEASLHDVGNLVGAVVLTRGSKIQRIVNLGIELIAHLAELQVQERAGQAIVTT